VILTEKDFKDVFYCWMHRTKPKLGSCQCVVSSSKTGTLSRKFFLRAVIAIVSVFALYSRVAKKTETETVLAYFCEFQEFL